MFRPEGQPIEEDAEVVRRGQRADHHDGGEGEAASTLHDLGDAVDEDDLLDQLRPVVLFASAAVTTFAVAALSRLKQ